MITLPAPVEQAFDLVTAAFKSQPLWTNPLYLTLGCGSVALIAFGVTRNNWIEATAVATLIGGGALSTGAILGFLFGIPRTVQEMSAENNKARPWDAVYRVNTNLEQISDWLTKIIVGVGLSQLIVIPKNFMSLAKYVASAFGEPTVPNSLVAVALAYFGIVGFLGTYLWTRLLLTLEFTRADRSARQSPEFYEGLVEALLYQPGPEGFQQAIESGQEFMSRYGQGNWRIWRSMACAYAQQYGYLQQQSPQDAAALGSARANALNAVKRVLYLNRGEKKGLRGLWEPGWATPEEDDLTVFFHDPDFRELLDDSFSYSSPP